MRKLIVIMLIFAGVVFAANMLTNGDFEQDLSVGWDQTIAGIGTITRGTTYYPDPDYEAYVYKADGNGFVTLFQAVDVEHTDLVFSVDAKLYIFATSSQCWAGAAVCVSYLNASDAVLGWTRICTFSIACPWYSNDTCHVIEAPDTSWHSYTFNIEDELQSLPGITPSEIAKIEVALLAQCFDD
ncbi:hypothetical protein AMJ83_00405 [candidate division WOR_3 bacterium SM23_42]|uniref:Uncharacterized protein n=1 Tax=candidate division WOR_3 bacterium SM23_42 TaxID=1703779 RepID=A0A0S8FVJ7_UNCW3|nr:MAG: hypothetical protein AMJ83_00405 [candidate division WOR_3 bacterium SM23_42]